MKVGFVYILQSDKNKSYYIGSTKNVDKRLQEHNQGKSKYTSHIVPLKLVFTQQFETTKIAKQMEYKLKQLKSAKCLKAIIAKGKFFLNNEGKINY